MIREYTEIEYQYKARITPPLIDWLMPDEVFVFGSNLRGAHGAGAALVALNRFGATSGIGFGLSGQSFAIPTKDYSIQTMQLDAIATYVSDFITYAKSNPQKTFLVTQIGCGLAGYTPEQIAPLFASAVNIGNIHLPAEFWAVLNRY